PRRASIRGTPPKRSCAGTHGPLAVAQPSKQKFSSDWLFAGGGMYTIEQDQEPVEPAALQQQSDEEQGTIEALRDACAALRMRNRALASSLRQATVAADEAGHRAERLRLESAAAIRQPVLQNDQLPHENGRAAGRGRGEG